MKIGKVICGVRYIHSSVMLVRNQLSKKEKELVRAALRCVIGFKHPKQITSYDDTIAKAFGVRDEVTAFTIIAFNVKARNVSFTFCPEWNWVSEPNLGQCVTVKVDSGIVTFRAATENNPQIYHSRHLFVAADYIGFDRAKDIERTKAWEAFNPDKTHMGRRVWWDHFCEEHNLIER